MQTQIKLCFLFLLLLPAGLVSQNQAITGLNLEEFESAKPIKPKEWNNNPFAKVKKTPDLASLQLFAVVVGSKKKAALIGQHIVEVGDKIGSFTVTSISRQEVILRGSSGTFKLTFNRSNANAKS